MTWNGLYRIACLSVVVAPGAMGQTPGQRKLTVEDIYRLREVSDPQISPDGAWVAYSVSVPDTLEDQDDSDIWMVSWDGVRNIRLTSSKASEHAPRWSPDGRYLTFLSDRDDAREVDQIWLLDRSGGEADRITHLPGGVSDYSWSPDSRRLALVASDPDPDSTATSADTNVKTTPKPIVIARFQFKEDETGYLDARRDHLYLFDLANRKAEILTPGQYTELAPAWSPDGRWIAFVSKRQPDPDRSFNWDLYVIEAKLGSVPRQRTTFEGPDMDPVWVSRAPSWSPDGKLLTYMQGGRPELYDFAGQKVALVPSVGGTARVLTPALDRNPLSPTFSSDGASVLFLLEDDRVYHLARVPTTGGAVERLVEGRRSISDISVGPDGKIAVLAGTPTQPFEIFAAEGGQLRKITTQNDRWLSEVQLAHVEEIEFDSKDGTEIHGFIVKPLNYRPGKRYPTILRIHGGPVWQYYNEFNFDWQVFAANGYVVVAANPRGSSGRGEKFSIPIWADWGNKDSEDVLAAVDFVLAKGIADPSRLGVGGWSYGGMLTNQVIARDQRFKAAISGAGQGNALAGYGTDQYIREYEAELGRPWESMAAWLRVSYPFFHADRIVTPTLFVCGEKDLNVPLLNSEQMFQALKSLGRETELVIYPGEYHEIRTPSYRVDRQKRYLEWYSRYLTKQGGQAATH